MFWIRLLTVTTFAALTACAVGPDFERPTPALPAAWSDEHDNVAERAGR